MRETEERTDEKGRWRVARFLFRVGHAKSDDQSDKAWRAEAWLTGVRYIDSGLLAMQGTSCVCHPSFRHLSVLTPQLFVIFLHRPKASFASIIISLE